MRFSIGFVGLVSVLVTAFGGFGCGDGSDTGTSNYCDTHDCSSISGGSGGVDSSSGGESSTGGKTSTGVGTTTGGTSSTSLVSSGGTETGGTSNAPNVWSPLGSNQPAGVVTEVAFDPRESHYAYVASGPHIYVSNDSGSTFRRTATLETAITNFGFPLDVPGRILAASGTGVVESTDYGKTWRTSYLQGLPLSKILVHPDDSRVVFVAIDNVGLLRSINGGTTWLPVSGGIPDGVFNNILGDPTNSQRILASLESFDSSGSQTTTLVESLDAGTSWHSLIPTAKGEARSVVACPSDFQTLLAGAGISLALSKDGGVNWSLLPIEHPITTSFAVFGTDCKTIFVADLLSHHSATLLRSFNGGTNFTGPHVTGLELLHVPFARKFAIDPSDPKHVLSTMPAGLFETRDSADHWDLVSNVGVPDIRQMLALTGANEIWATTWGAGLWKWQDQTESWTPIPTPINTPDALLSVTQSPVDSKHIVIGGSSITFQTHDSGSNFTLENTTSNVFSTAFSTVDASTVLSTSDYYGAIRSVTSGTAPWETYNTGLTPFPSDVPFFGNGYFTRSVAFDSSGNAYLGHERRGLRYLPNGDSTWVSIAPELSNTSVRCLLPKVDAVYACTDSRGVARIDVNSKAVTLLATGLRSLDVTGLTADGNQVYATTSKGVYRLTSTNAWEELPLEGLPSQGTATPVIYRDDMVAKLVVKVDNFGVYAMDL